MRGLAAMANLVAARGTSPPKAHVDARGTLIIHGCRGNDRVELVGNRGAQVAYTHFVNGRIVVHQQKFNGIRNVVFLAYDGNNTFINNTNLPSKALGGAGVDRFFGGSGADVFYGLGGNDVLEGRAGSDRLYGGTGEDILRAGGGTEDAAGLVKHGLAGLRNRLIEESSV